MGVIDVLLVAVGLSMDAFAVAVGKGLTMRRISWRIAFTLAFFFGLFQALMPLVGWVLGSSLLWLIEPIDHWVAFGLLASIGAKMLWDALHAERTIDDSAQPSVNLAECLVLAVATSIDALAVGISFATLGVNIAFAVPTIGAVTFMLTLAGVIVGYAFGSRYERGAGIVGGIVLIVIGLRILLEHLGILAF